MVDTVKEFYTHCQQLTQIAQATAPHMVHRTMVYLCRNPHCHNYYIMRVEKGLEEGGESHKPVPFSITCPACLTRADHVLWSMDQTYEYRELEERSNFFINLPNEDCGIPVIFGADATNFSKVMDILGILPEVIHNGAKISTVHMDDLFDSEEKCPDLKDSKEMVVGFGKVNRKSRRHFDAESYDSRRYIRPKKGQSKYF